MNTKKLRVLISTVLILFLITSIISLVGCKDKITSIFKSEQVTWKDVNESIQELERSKDKVLKSIEDQLQDE